MYEVILVAEKSVISGLSCVVDSLFEAGIASKAIIICPRSQKKLFESLNTNFNVEVWSEEKVLKDYSISNVKGKLGVYGYRAGWYYQQFIKLAFCQITNKETYLIWDADTLCLDTPKFQDNGKYIFTPSKELHKPYYQTFYKLFGYRIVAKKSFISQYMLIDTNICRQMLKEISKKNQNKDWIVAVLDSIDLSNQSEFSEYETYGNFISANFPNQVIISHGNKWFRYGSDLIVLNAQNYRTIKKLFSGYKFVAFERHKKSFIKTLRARIYLVLRISS